MSTGKGNIYIHHQGRYFSKTFLFLGLLLIAVPVILSFTLVNWPLVLVPLGAFMFVPAQQFEVDFNHKKFRDCTNILGYKLGEWQDLSNLKLISISKKRYTITMPTGVMAMDSKEDELFVSLLRFQMKNGKKVDIDEFDKFERGLALGKDLMKGLNVPLYNVTTNPPTILN